MLPARTGTRQDQRIVRRIDRRICDDMHTTDQQFANDDRKHLATRSATLEVDLRMSFAVAFWHDRQYAVRRRRDYPAWFFANKYLRPGPVPGPKAFTLNHDLAAGNCERRVYPSNFSSLIHLMVRFYDASAKVSNETIHAALAFTDGG